MFSLHKLGFAFLLAASASLASAADPATKLFDSHVHLWKGDDPYAVYQQQLKDTHLEVAGIGGMWFGGVNQALAGDPAGIRAGNDSILALAAKHPEVLPIATVHPVRRRSGFERARAGCRQRH